MSRISFVAVAFLLALNTFMSQAQTQAPASAKPQPPESPRGDVVDVLHGVRIPGPYRWLEDQNSPETRSWINAQNAYTKSVLSEIPGRDHISARLGELLKIDSIEPPLERGDRYFFRERRASQEQFVIQMRQGGHGQDDVLIDPHSWSADHSTSVEILNASEDGKLLIYGIRKGGADEMEIRIFDVDGRKDLSDRLPSSRYFSVVMLPDKTGLYYSLMKPEAPAVRYHVMGKPVSEDTEIFGKGYGSENIVVADLTEDGRYLVIQAFYGSSSDKTDVYYRDLKQTNSLIQPIVKDIDARFEVTPGGDQLYMSTNWKAPNGRVLRVDLQKPGRENWQEVVPENSSTTIRNIAVAGGKLFVNYLHDVSSQVMVFTDEGKPQGEITFPAAGSVEGIQGHWLGREAFFQYSSFHIPPTIYSYTISTNKETEWARLNVPLESSDFELKQVWYESKDKTRVPMFMLYKKGLKLDGSNPTLMTAYGGFNVSLSPEFRAYAVVWAEHGGVVAVPNLRGGGEFGEKWHKAGMLANKQSVFEDFFSAAQWLINNQYTNPSKLAITGRSNGGLLMGAAMTQHPELFKAIVCGYPLLDMLRYQDFLVARFWVPEYGSAEDAQQFKYLYAYSPYQHVTKGTKYPAVMFVTGDSDTRVAPLHARKMAALMQWATAGSDDPVLMHYDTEAGHSQGVSVSKQIHDATDELSFLMWQVGMQP